MDILHNPSLPEYRDHHVGDIWLKKEIPITIKADQKEEII